VFEINVDDPDEKQKRILEQVFKSEIVNLLGELRGRPLDREPSIVSKDKKVVNNREKQEVVVDIVFGRMFGPVSRRLLVQYPTSDKNNISVMVGACRPGDFERMQEKFREAFASAKQ
jgi:hypothetical protein